MGTPVRRTTSRRATGTQSVGGSAYSRARRIPREADLSTVVVKRPPRRAAPDIPTGEVLVNAPPEIPPPAGSRWQQFLQVVPMLTGTVATALLFAGRDGGTYSLIIGAIFGFSTLGMLF